MKLRFYSVALMMGVVAGVAVGADEKVVEKPVVVSGEIVRTKGTPIAQLPEGIPSTEGKVTLFADYARAKKGEPIDVYLINRSEKDISLNAQDGDVYLKLEKENADGTWTRVQPHVFSWCGNSYGWMALEKSCFYRFKGHQPKVGNAAKIRFRLYTQQWLNLATDAGDGMVSDEEAQLAAYDELAVRTGPFEVVRDVATGTKTVGMNEYSKGRIRRAAIRSLGSGRFDPVYVLPVLDEIEQKFPDEKSSVDGVRQVLREMQGN
ncbi:hypothetical protein [Prosthecobacter sp.]|uniref:hypothetical protein n=1 Tax=Prosthecobacter sp. TaxID=1965333 RepID=UPI003784E2BC